MHLSHFLVPERCSGQPSRASVSRACLKGGKRIAVLIAFSVSAAIAVGLLSSQAHACDVPVFRYALERWPVDQYRAIAVEATPFAKDEKAALATLRKRISSDGLNLRLQTIKQDAFVVSEYARAFPARISANTLILFYPRSSGLSLPVWDGSISSEAVDQLSSCDVRSKLTKRILGGSSAVFLLLESGDSKKDKAARLLLRTTLEELNGRIKLPAAVVAAGSGEMVDDEINQLESPVPFKVDLTFLCLPPSKSDGAVVDILRDCLLGLEADLKDFQDEPMVFAIYGRGRALPPLIGKGINANMIEQIAGFVTGACSCQIKTQNPGTDLLLKQDWDTAVFGTVKERMKEQRTREGIIGQD